MGRALTTRPRDGLSVTFGLVRRILNSCATENLPNMARCFLEQILRRLQIKRFKTLDKLPVHRRQYALCQVRFVLHQIQLRKTGRGPQLP